LKLPAGSIARRYSDFVAHIFFKRSGEKQISKRNSLYIQMLIMYKEIISQAQNEHEIKRL
jgi:hypothetical protein